MSDNVWYESNPPGQSPPLDNFSMMATRGSQVSLVEYLETSDIIVVPHYIGDEETPFATFPSSAPAAPGSMEFTASIVSTIEKSPKYKRYQPRVQRKNLLAYLRGAIPKDALVQHSWRVIHHLIRTNRLGRIRRRAMEVIGTVASSWLQRGKAHFTNASFFGLRTIVPAVVIDPTQVGAVEGSLVILQDLSPIQKMVAGVLARAHWVAYLGVYRNALRRWAWNVDEVFPDSRMTITEWTNLDRIADNIQRAYYVMEHLRRQQQEWYAFHTQVKAPRQAALLHHLYTQTVAYRQAREREQQLFDAAEAAEAQQASHQLYDAGLPGHVFQDEEPHRSSTPLTSSELEQQRFDVEEAIEAPQRDQEEDSDYPRDQREDSE